MIKGGILITFADYGIVDAMTMGDLVLIKDVLRVPADKRPGYFAPSPESMFR